MSDTATMSAVCNSFEDIWEIIALLDDQGIELAKLSLVGLSPDPGDHVVGFYHSEGKSHSLGLSPYDLWSRIKEAGLFVLPGTGPVVVAGPLLQVLVSTLDEVRETHYTGGVSIIAAALRNLGTNGEKLRHFDTALKAGEVVIVYSGESEETERVRSLLEPRRTIYFSPRKK